MDRSSHSPAPVTVPMRSGSSTALRATQVFLFAAGATGLAYCLVVGLSMLYARRAAHEMVHGSPTVAEPGSLPASILSAAVYDAHRPAVVGRVEIPAIGLVTPLLAGDDSMSLSMGAGHIPGTAFPGGLGTVGIAGHRDTHFRLLAKVTPGMEIRLINPEGIYRYRATSSEIVAPEQVSVLAIGDVPALALVTCYPFGFIGHAPKRFVVHASLISAAADTSAIPYK